MTPTHKLILSDQDDPWLLDLDQDPDELINFIERHQPIEPVSLHLRAAGCLEQPVLFGRLDPFRRDREFKRASQIDNRMDDFHVDDRLTETGGK